MRTKKNRQSGSSKFKLRSNREGTTSFKMMGSKRSAYPKADPVLVKGGTITDKDKNNASAYKMKKTPYKDDDDNKETNNIDDTKNVDDTSTTENMSFDVPNETALMTEARENKEEQDVELQKFRDKQKENSAPNFIEPEDSDGVVTDPDSPDGGIEQGTDLTGTDYAYNDKGDIIQRESTLDKDVETQFVKGPDEVDPETTYGPFAGSGRVRENFTNPEDANKGDYSIEDLEKRNLSGPRFGVAVPEDQFANNRVSSTDPETGEVTFMGTQNQYGDDISIPYDGPTQAESATIGVSEKTSQNRTAGPGDTWGGAEKLQNYGDGLIEGAVDDIQDTVTGRNKVEGTIKQGEDQGNKMKLVVGRGGPERNLLSKKVIKSGPLGLKREKEIHKRNKMQKGITINPNTGEPEVSNDSIVSIRKVIDPETGKIKRTKFVNGREWTPEYKEELKLLKKSQRINQKINKKEDKQNKKDKKRNEFRNKQLMQDSSGNWVKNPNYNPNQ
jgi:hypothetical protein